MHECRGSSGRIRAAIRALRPASWQDTLVIFASDNGPEWPAEDGAGSAGTLRGMKRSLLEGGIRTPALVEWPARIGANAVSAALTWIVDIPATIVDVLGATPPVALDGQSWLPLIDVSTRAGFERTSGLFVCSSVNALASSLKNFCPDVGYISESGVWSTSPLQFNVSADARQEGRGHFPLAIPRHQDAVAVGQDQEPVRPLRRRERVCRQRRQA